jgi:Tol biopolymer transport system component
MPTTHSPATRHAALTTTVGLVLATLVAVGSSPSATAATDEVAAQPVGSTRLISRGFDGKPAGDESASGSVSDDGRYVAFFSRATDIVPSPRCEPDDGCVYLFDRGTGETVLASVSPTGEAPNDEVGYSPRISGDGRYVFFDSAATNLVPGDRNRSSDVFAFDRESGTTKLISRTSEGDPASGHSFEAIPSEDGRYAVYMSNAEDLVPGGRGRALNVVRTDLTTGATILVSRKPNGEPPPCECTPNDVSADGRVVLYRTESKRIVRGDDNGLFDVFAYDTETGETEVVSRAPDGTVAAGNSGSGSISDDGRFVTFVSNAVDVVTPDTLGHYDVFRLDRATGEMLLVTRSTQGGPANGDSGGSTINADGSLVGFSSAATDLVPDDDDGDLNGIFVADLVSGTTSELTTGRHGEPTDGWSSSPFLSGSGNVVAFQSEATNLVRGDRNDARDVFVYRRF